MKSAFLSGTKPNVIIFYLYIFPTKMDINWLSHIPYSSEAATNILAAYGNQNNY